MILPLRYFSQIKFPQISMNPNYDFRNFLYEIGMNPNYIFSNYYNPTL